MRRKLLLIPAIVCLFSMIAMLSAGCTITVTPDSEVPAVTTTAAELTSEGFSEKESETEQTDATDIETSDSASDAASDSAAADSSNGEDKDETDATQEQSDISEDGEYTSKDDVALYIHTYGHLPSNFVTKNEARDAGWEGGSLENYFPGCSIGGDVFGNREGLLPKKSGRKYYECDIDTRGADSRGAKRIVFSNDGLIYYTDDHYESFTLLYGEEFL